MTMAMRLAGEGCGAETPGTGTIRELVTGPGAGGRELATAAVACGAGPRAPLIPPLSTAPVTSPAAPIAGFQPVAWWLKRIMGSWFFRLLQVFVTLTICTGAGLTRCWNGMAGPPQSGSDVTWTLSCPAAPVGALFAVGGWRLA